MARMTKRTAEEKEAARLELLDILKPSQEVFTILRHVSRSGMLRHISVLVMEDGQPREISHLIARTGEYRRDPHDGGLVTTGCGMDMGFEIVYNLGRLLFSNGYGCTGKGCRSNAHSNGDRDYTPHNTCKTCKGTASHVVKNGEGIQHWHKDGGYAFIHRWL